MDSPANIIFSSERSENGGDLGTNEADLFDISVDKELGKPSSNPRSGPGRGAAAGPNTKRQKKDEKFGFGGKKRFAKSNDARSTSDLSGYSVTKMKGKGGKQRPGKSRRARMG